MSDLDWKSYRRNINTGRQYSFLDLGFPVGASPYPVAGFVHEAFNTAAIARVEQLLLLWAEMSELNPVEKGRRMTDEHKVFDLAMAFLEAADNGDFERFDELLVAGVPVNFQHPRHLDTAMHISCSRDAANAMTDKLLSVPGIDLLLRDQYGRQAWNNAQFFGIHPDLAAKVYQASRQQAEDQGLLDEFEADYQSLLAEWIQQDWFHHLAYRQDFTAE